MYTWKEIPILTRLDERLKRHEEEFINSLADIVTKTIMDSLESYNLDEIETIIRQIQKNPGLIGTFCFPRKEGQQNP